MNIQAARFCRLALNPAVTNMQRLAEIESAVKLHRILLTVRLNRTVINLSNFMGSSQGNPASVVGIATKI
jgi:hypothetical protein